MLWQKHWCAPQCERPALVRGQRPPRGRAPRMSLYATYVLRESLATRHGAWRKHLTTLFLAARPARSHGLRLHRRQHWRHLPTQVSRKRRRYCTSCTTRCCASRGRAEVDLDSPSQACQPHPLNLSRRRRLLWSTCLHAFGTDSPPRSSEACGTLAKPGLETAMPMQRGAGVFRLQQRGLKVPRLGAMPWATAAPCLCGHRRHLRSRTLGTPSQTFGPSLSTSRCQCRL